MVPIDLPPTVESSLIAYVEERCDAARVEVKWLGVDPDTLPDADAMVWEGDPCRARPDLRLSLVHHHTPVWRATLRPALHTWVATPVAAQDAAAGEPVRIVEGLARIERVGGEPVAGDGWTARVPISAGEPVTDRVVERPPDAPAGQAVTLHLRRGSLQLSAPGRLLHDARVGQQVRVSNDATRTTARGVLVNPQTVELR